MTQETGLSRTGHNLSSDSSSDLSNVTVIVPTYNERDNVAALVERVAAAMSATDARILFVDDSSDDTPQVIEQVARTSPLPVECLHRLPGRRTGGLGGAVLAGLREATTDWVVVMDGDLQHPPEVLPRLLAAATDDADVVVASRYGMGGSADGLADGWRHGVSTGAGVVAKVLFPRALHGCSDPMSGFFAVRRQAVAVDDLRPDGFKILLEILARGRPLRVREVGFIFASRVSGESKAGLRQGLTYGRQLARLRMCGHTGRLAGFLAIGASGLVPNLVAMALLTRLGMHYLDATVLAAIVAIVWNFILTDLLVFRARRARSWARRFLGYFAINGMDLALRLPLMVLLVQVCALGVLPATLVACVTGSLIRFAVVNRWVYRIPVVAVELEVVNAT